MRVLMLSKAMVVGSYQRKAELLAAEPDIDLTLAVPPLWRDGDLVRRLERRHTAGYALVETPIVRPGDFHLHMYPRFGRVLRDAQPDVVHVDEEPYNLATFLALAQARRRGARTIFFTWQNLCRRYPPPFRWFERYAYRHADGAIAGSRTAGEVLRAKGYQGRLWHIAQVGVDTDAYCPAAGPGLPSGAGMQSGTGLPSGTTLPPEAGLRTGPELPTGPALPPGSTLPAGSGPPPIEPPVERPFTVGFAGRLVRGKGVDLLVDALADLDRPWRLHVVGEGPEQVALATRARERGVGERITWTAWLSSDRMPDFYRSLDALVLPSRATPGWIEQFGRVLTEAMACGVPCVGSDSGEIPHVIGDAGLVFPENDAGALGRALAALAGDPAWRARLASEGRARVLARFSMAGVVADTAAVYRAVVG